MNIMKGEADLSKIIIVAEETLKTDEETVITHEEGVLQGLLSNLTAGAMLSLDKLTQGAQIAVSPAGTT